MLEASIDRTHEAILHPFRFFLLFLENFSSVKDINTNNLVISNYPLYFSRFKCILYKYNPNENVFIFLDNLFYTQLIVELK
jgi:hypothetical protein